MPKASEMICGEDYCIRITSNAALSSLRSQSFVRGTYRRTTHPPPGKQRSFWHIFEVGGNERQYTLRSVESTWAEYEQTDHYKIGFKRGLHAAWDEQCKAILLKAAQYAARGLGAAPPSVVYSHDPERIRLSVSLPKALEILRMMEFPTPTLDLPPDPSLTWGDAVELKELF